ncbi:MAG: exodeoxyribonuclease V subunit beta, partial [Mariprofundales bacterium]|nr:exodeoxyribonuclease V subunit beta [Mariprofundales bacterium]
AAIASLEKLIELQRPLRKPGVTLLPREEEWQELHRQWQQLADMWHKEPSVAAKALHSEKLKRQKKLYKLHNIPPLLQRMESYFSSEPFATPPLLPAEGVVNMRSDLDALRQSTLHATLKSGQQEPLFDHPLFALIERVADRVATMADKTMLDALQSANHFAHRRVAEIKQRSQQMSYDDQLIQLNRALTNSPELRSAIQQRFPMAMIDEFQDTDTIQYSIFHQLYATATSPSTTSGLILIGDPKQAIYGFRGGDIFAYIEAKNGVQQHYTLDTNWRSTPALTTAVNRLLSIKKRPFIYRQISFDPVKPAKKQHALLRMRGREVTPITLWTPPVAEDGKRLNREEFTTLLHRQSANEIASLLNSARQGHLTLGDRAVEAGDIAVLVRDHYEATALHEQLRKQGVNAVTASRQSLFESAEAKGVAPLLAAVIHCRDGAYLRRALASTLLDSSYHTIHHRVTDEGQWLKWSSIFIELHELWAERGFMPTFQRLLKRLEIGDQLACTPRAERRLTNLLHLGELLQQASQSISGMEPLLSWLLRQLSNPKQAGEEAEMRLESDDALVQIVTVHASKGLEYPIVLLPYLWACKPRSLKMDLLPFYDKQRLLDAGKDPKHLILAEKERLAEDVRLTYVALTRACAKLYLAWGDAGTSSNQSALGWLLHDTQQSSDLNHELPNARIDSESVTAALKQLCATDSGIEYHTIEPDPPITATDRDHQDAQQVLTATPFSGTIATNWRIISFSSLTRSVHQPSTSPSRQSSLDPIFTLPAGSQVGLFLHAMLEQLDFQGDVAADIATFTQREALHYGLNAEAHTATLQHWIAEVIATPLNSAGLTLADVAPHQRLNELSFDFSIADLKIDDMNQLLSTTTSAPLQPLQAQDCRGFVTGVIDLLFLHNGRFYIIDYKSNHLGERLNDYRPEALQQAVWSRRYDLQYLIYTLAIHRYLKLRVTDYHYDTHVGGIYYLFMRGMRSEMGHRYGVYADRPPYRLIKQLDEELFRAPRVTESG